MNLLSSAISQPSEVYSSTAVSFAFCCVLLPCSNKKFYLLCASFPLHFLLRSFQSYRTSVILSVELTSPSPFIPLLSTSAEGAIP